MNDPLLKKIWSRKGYYQRIDEKENYSHPGFLEIQRQCKNTMSILDVGSGDASKLARLGSEQTSKVGSDLSLTGMRIGKKKYPQTQFVVSDAGTLPFKNNIFECVTSFFVLEHTQDPQRVVEEMVRVTKINGKIFILAPNFGAPNRASPNYRGSRILKFLTGIALDARSSGKSLSWKRVIPSLSSPQEFEPDSDTTVEPYLFSLKRFIRTLPIHLVKADSYWEMELPRPKLWQRLNHWLADLGIFPFTDWGPHLFLIMKKV